MDKIPRPVETASSATSLISELFAKNFVLRVLENIDCFEQENVIVARSTINRLVKTERISVHWSKN